MIELMDATYRYTPIIPKREIAIDRLFTLHYLENHKNYFFSGELHNFWEVFYVDRGEVIADTDWMKEPVHLEQGDLLIYRPREFHRTYANNITPCNLLVFAFESSSPAMDYFYTHTLFHTRGEARRQLGILMHEAKKNFTADSLTLSNLSVQRCQDAVFGSEQLVIMMMEWLLIQLYRNDYESDSRRVKQEESRYASGYVDRAIAFMKSNLRKPISLEDICTNVNISRSQLQKMFNRHLGTSVMHYLIQMRMEEAKFLICSGNMSFTEIAEVLCYSSVHHFSKQFRKTVGMPPTEYAESIHAFADSIPRYQIFGDESSPEKMSQATKNQIVDQK
mgnify:CR=1 FL=1